MRSLLLHRGIIFLAGILLCLHTLLPHVHANFTAGTDALSMGTRPEVNHSLLDLLSGLVEGDLGQEHLENFTQGKADLEVVKTIIAPAAAPLPSTPDFTTIAPATGTGFFLTAAASLQDPGYPGLQPLRGPPVPA